MCPSFGSARRGTKRLGNTDGAALNTGHLNARARVSLGSSIASAVVRDDLAGACSKSDNAKAVLLEPFPCDCISVVAAAACLVLFLLDPAALGRHAPWRMKLQSLALVAAFVLGVSSAVCTCQAPFVPHHSFVPSPACFKFESRDSQTPKLVLRPLVVAPPMVRFILPRCTCLRLLMLCTCPPLCVGVLWPMPSRVWHDVPSFFFFCGWIIIESARRLCIPAH